MQAVILAAGGGSRLNPLTLTRSKAMLPILGKPMIRRVMDNIAGCGIRDFIVVASPHDRELIHYLEQRQVEHVQMTYQSPARGAADALLHAAALIEGDFLLSACDNLVPLPDLQGMLDCWRSGAAPKGLLALLPIPTAEISSAGIVELDGEWVVRIVEKPALAEAPSNIASLPLYYFRPDLLAYLPRVQPSLRGEYELQDAIQMLIDALGGVRGIHIQSRMTLTRAEDLLALNRHFLALQGDHSLPSPQDIPPEICLYPPVRIEPGAQIGAGCTIGPEAYLEAGCRLGDGVRIQQSVVLRGAVIPAGANISGQVVT
ncbi:MAG: hypothetical protein A2W36_01475 [Chloroflexi bacterium RBG_16_58_14]|nr:MAG: hypothetical protein A2W36_01475 [Chloroflexi bacterium RBG_16_58_14]